MARNIGGNPIGTLVRFAAAQDRSEPGEWHEVIGVVRNLGLTPTARGEADFMYLPLAAADAPLVVVRVSGDAESFAPRLRAVAVKADPELRLNGLLSLAEIIRREELSTIHATLGGLGVLLLAIILSAASLHALMAVSVAQRTREIGVRLAIGASPRAVLNAMFARAAKQVGAGIVMGNALVVAVLVMSSDRVRPGALLPALMIASLVMAAVGLGACLVPARRALRVQPPEALKQS